MIKYFHIVLMGLLMVSLFSCEDERYMNSPDAQLRFSADTVMFDTIFTTVGSTTQHLKVINPYNDKILIQRIRLAGGDLSNFRMNVNGIPGNEIFDVEIPARDSIYIFVEVTIDPNGQSLPMVVKDSIVFTTNAKIQDVDLIAWGQDFHLIRNAVIKTTTWKSDKPYLVYNYAYIDTLQTLTIEPGARIFFHKGAGLYVKGNLLVNGTYENQVWFQADRMEDSYKNIPDQWNGILLFSGSKGNVFNYANIRNANIGLQVGTIEHDGFASVTLANTKIENMAYAGIFALKSKVTAYNSLVANCGFYAAALLVGGEYEFYHTTIANYWGSYSRKPRKTASLVLSNTLIVSKADGTEVKYVGDLNKAHFGNCIIFGNNTAELELGKTQDKAFNYFFDHCILQVPDTFNISDRSHYVSVFKGKQYDPKFIDPSVKFNYALDTLSPAKDVGSETYSRLFPYDFNGKDRTADKGPDLGAFERVEKKKE